MLRTHTCGELRSTDVGRRVTLAGWVGSIRDHGGVSFVDLRDRYGRTQAVLRPDRPALAAAATHLKPEVVVQVDGTVTARASGQRNPKLPTGDVEVVADAVRVLSPARTPPFDIGETGDINFETRMRYRYLDLRRAGPQALLVLRHDVVAHIRQFLGGRQFVEVETPILFKSTPEGAREFLVPSRLNRGQVYALPQSPQQFKQLLMVAGMDRYFQIARCFRDEDPRIDRQWEFTQLDIEMSFVESADVRAVVEGLYLELFARFAPGAKLLATPLPILGYPEAMARYGTDKPDLRFGCAHVHMADLFADAGPAPLVAAAKAGGEVRAIPVPAAGKLSRAKLDALEVVAKSAGAGGMGWLDLDPTPPRGNVAKGLAPGQAEALAQRCGRKAGDVILLVAGPADVAAAAGDAVRRAAADTLGLAPKGLFAVCWVVDFPLFLRDGDRWISSHHPFTAPRDEDLAFLEADPGRVRSHQYDLVCNGQEIGGGSIRIHRPDLQQRVFAVLGLSPEAQQRKFGHLLEAFSYGTPPHGGIATGVDRLVCLLADVGAIREVIAFPKSARGQCLMSGSPTPPEASQLAELGVQFLPAPGPAAAAGGPA